MSFRVSIIVNTFQERRDWLETAIGSCLKQDGVDVQLIVSTVRGDLAVSVAKEFEVEVVTSRKPGIYSQLNKALAAVTGDWFCYFSGNDAMLSGKSVTEIGLCVSKKRVCYSAYYYANEDLIVTGTTRGISFNYQTLLRTRNFIADVSVMHRSVLDEYGPFKEEFGNYAYWDFWLRVAEAEGNVFAFNPRPTWIYRMSASSRHVRKRRDRKLRSLDQAHHQRVLASRGII